LSDAMFLGERRRITDLARARALPAIYTQREFVEAGGLVSYGPSLIEMSRRGAQHVDKILRGAKPQDVPVEQPTIKGRQRRSGSQSRRRCNIAREGDWV